MKIMQKNTNFYYAIICAMLVFISCSPEKGNRFNYSWFSNTDNNRVENPPKEYAPIHQEALAYIKKKNYNPDYYFLLDYEVHPGRKRFFIYDCKRGQITDSALVTHGACDVNERNPEKWEKAKFSNQPDSHCSSKGKFVLGNRDWSGWGIGVKYWLKGLESTNNNAEKRVVVLHSWEAVPDAEVFPETIALSWGCPAVSNSFMRTLDNKIQNSSNQKVLLWIL